MNIENPLAYSFIMQDDLYLLNNDKMAFHNETQAEVVSLPAAETSKLNYKYLGENKKQLLIIVYYPGDEFMAASHLTALESTLNRLGPELDDVAIFNIANYPDVSFEEALDYFIPQKLLVLGDRSLPHGIAPLQLNKPVVLDKCRTLFTFSFDAMMDNNEYKKAFWEQMKQF